MRLWIGIVLALLAAACGSVPVGSPEQIARGKAIYAEYCASCHGAKGEGQRPDAPLEKDETGRYPAPPHNDSGHTWHHDDDMLFAYVRDGGIGDPASFYEMPAFGDKLSDDNIRDVLIFIKTMWSEEHRAYQRQMTEQARSSE